MQRQKIEATIELLINNLVNLNDPDGKYAIPLADGRFIDNKSFHYWEWTAGVGLYGMMKYYKLTKNENVLAMIIDWFERQFQEPPVEKNVNTMVQMLTLAYLYEETNNPTYLPYLETWGDWLYHDMPRTKDGGFQHIVFGSENNGQLWDDTLMMSVLPLAKIGLLLNKQEYVEEAKRQFIIHIKYLFDKKTGLWFHGWTFEGNHNFAEALWGRGNAWITIAIPEFLDLVDLHEDDAVRQVLVDTLDRQLEALEKCQNENGLWHTLLLDPTSYVEASCTAGFGFGTLKAVRQRYVSTNYLPMGMKAVQAVIDNINEIGELQHVSAGTAMGETLEFYKEIPVTAMPYGQSMAILALVEYLYFNI
ncbi:glycoside hydrolase family 88 protein [Bacillus sp. FJAT-50079]|uniref:beta-galactosidase BglB n=1 Tax=Bacillus sp. FJAT-50079 TaxID=2833577 RepID=UPI001BC8CFCB|nr:glycoside hydrolase family 88 protein [Bacillus sp. FJAT-50079]MBS4207831.1 glycoside hydrolase family 88 protein [Bacillus sp. FJAT-50079]